MITSNINNGNFNISKNYKISLPSAHKPDGDTKDAANSANDTNIPEISNLTFKKNINIKSTLNHIAQYTRVADSAFNKIESLIKKINTNMKKIIKNFPPFPPGSEERLKILKSISTFRKQINDLTIPAPEVEKWDVVQAREYENIVNLSEIKITYFDEHATDEKISSLIKETEAISDKISKKKAELKLNLSNAVNSSLNVLMENKDNMISENISDENANKISIIAGNQLSETSKTNVIGNNKLLEE